MNAIDAARYLIQRNLDAGVPITNLKLQKILYYVQGYSFRQLNSEAFSDPVYRWPYGPVVPSVYFAYNINRANEICELDDLSIDSLKTLRAYDGIKNLVDAIDDACKGKSAAELVNMTHHESPWMEAADSKEISKSSIRAFFKKNNPLGITVKEG